MTPRRSALIFALLCLAGVLLHPPRVDAPINPQDDGIWLALAQAVHEGKTLYKDVALHFGPLPVLALGPATGEGMTLSSVRAAFWVMNLLGLFAIFGAAVRRYSRPWAIVGTGLLLALIPFAAHAPAIPYAVRYGAGFLPILFWERGRGPWAGLAAGAAYWVSQEVGAASAVAGMVFFGWTEGFRGAARFAAGTAAVVGGGLALLAARGLLPAYFSSSVTDIGGLIYHLRRPFPSWSASSWLSAADAVAARAPLALSAAVMAAAFSRLRREPWFPAAFSLAVYAALASASGLLRSDRWHVYFSLSPALFLGGFLVDRAGGWRIAGAVLAAGLFLTVPPAVEALRRDARWRGELALCSVPRAGRSRLSPGQVMGYEALAFWADVRVPPGEPFFYYPFNGAVYFMTDRPNPCRLPLPVDAAKESQRLAIVDELSRSRVRWVVRDVQAAHHDGRPVDEVLSPVWDSVKERFRLDGTLGPWEFWRLKDPAPDGKI